MLYRIRTVPCTRRKFAKIRGIFRCPYIYLTGLCARSRLLICKKRGRERYRERKHIVEAVNGWIRGVMASGDSVSGVLPGRPVNGI